MSGVRRALSRAGNALLLLAVVALVGLPPLLLSDAIAYMPLIAVCVLVPMSYASLRITGRAVGFDECAMRGRCERGERIDFEVTLRNASVLPVPRLEVFFYVTDLFGDYADLVPVTATLAPRESKAVTFDAAFKHLGTYQAGVDRVVIHDFLGLFSTTVENMERHDVEVAPRVFDVGERTFEDAASENVNKMFRPVLSDDMDYAGVREYRYGDPMKNVHWNLSARQPGTELFVRQFEVMTNPALAVVVDAVAPSYGGEDLMEVFDGLMEVAVSMSAYAKELGLDCRVSVPDEAGEYRDLRLTGSGDCADLVFACAPVRTEAQAGRLAGGAVERLAAEVNSVHGAGNIVFVTSRPQSAFGVLAAARLRRRNPLLVAVVPYGLEGDARRKVLAPLAALASSQVPYLIAESTEIQTRMVTR